MQLRTLRQLNDIRGKTVLLRVDYNTFQEDLDTELQKIKQDTISYHTFWQRMNHYG